MKIVTMLHQGSAATTISRIYSYVVRATLGILGEEVFGHQATFDKSIEAASIVFASQLVSLTWGRTRA